MLGRILKFDDFFNENDDFDRFTLIENIPRVELIATISSINHLIKSPLDISFNNALS